MLNYKNSDIFEFKEIIIMSNLSRFAKFVDMKNGYYAVFNSLLREVYFCDEEKIKEIKEDKISTEERIELKNAGIIHTFNEDKQLLDAYRETLKNEHTNVILVYVIPSAICNLKCDYCYVYSASNDYEGMQMKKETVDRFLEVYVHYLTQNNIRKATIQFYGGEPCCNWEIVQYFVQKAEELFDFEYIIITNGTILDQDKLDFIEKNNIGVGLSIDGTKTITDMHRKFINNEGGVYDALIETIGKILSREIRLALSVTITKEFLDSQDETLKLFDELGVQSVNYNLLHVHVDDPELVEYYNEATDFLIKAYERLKQKGIVDDRIRRKIEPFVKNYFYFADCGAEYANQIVLKPNGNIGICQGECLAKKRELGNIYTDSFENIINHNKRFEWKSSLPIFKEWCLDCEAISLCGGGCALQASELDKITNLDKGFCVHNKKLFFWLLQKLYDVS